MASKAMAQIARELRQRQTPAETILWEALRNRRLDGLKFRRQHPIADTHFVADFVCYEEKLVIELDGVVHETQSEADAERQAIIETQGYRVIRFQNEHVYRQLEGVLTRILEVVDSPQ
jgi:very-short-patch-repair endonuclease